MTKEQFIEELALQARERSQVMEEFKSKVWEDFKARIVEYVEEYGYMVDQESLLHEGYKKMVAEMKRL